MSSLSGTHHDEAEAGYRKVLTLCRKVHGEEHAGTANVYSDLASNQESQGKYADAEREYRK